MEEFNYISSYVIMILKILVLKCLENFRDVLDNVFRLGGRCIPLYWLSILVNQELGEVPLDGIKTQSTSLFTLQIFVEWMGIVSIDFDFSKDIPFNIILLQEFFYVNRTSRFLIVELIAGKSQDFQSLILELIVQLIQLFVICLGQSTVGCDIHNEQWVSPVQLHHY